MRDLAMFESDVEDKTNDVKNDKADGLSLIERDEVRSQLQADVEAFLSRGGQVTQIDNNVRADPPRKPTMNYGSAPI